MSTPTKFDSSFLHLYQQELDESFRAYVEAVNPFIVQFEMLKNEFPIEILNEIRAIYGHLARAAIAETAEQAEQNIQKIKAHTKRALLDCYKYSCIIFTDNYSDFFQRYKGVDLSYLDDGRFLPDVHAYYKEAKNAYFAAKKAETSNISEDELFELYQNAYNSFASLDAKLLAAEDSATFLKHKATRKEIISYSIGAAGIIITIVAAVITFL